MWINAAMLAALVVAVLPVAVHLVMRGRPRQMDFPALRFVRQSHLASAGRTRLKRWLLLALRAAALALFVLVLARPIDSSGVAASYQDVPAAAVFCFDTSASMQYRCLGQSRLEAAQQLAARILAGLPSGSRTAVLDLATDPATVTLRDAAGQAADDIRRLTPTSRSDSVAAMLRTAARLLDRVGEARREIYLFTDMTDGAWDGLDAKALASLDHILVYVMDVSAGEHQNLALGPVELSSRRVSVHTPLAITTSVSCGDRPAERTVVLEIDGQIRRRQTVKLDQPHSVQAVTFDYQPTEQGLLQGSVALLEPDPLAADNRRFFTVEVCEPASVAVVYGGTRVPQAGEAAFMVDQAVAPALRRAEGRAGAAPELVAAADLAAASLGGYEAVFLVDAHGLTDDAWQALDDFVTRGGGLVVIAGDGTAAELAAGHSSYDSPAARRLLGVRLGKAVSSPKGMPIDPPDYTDAALAAFDGGAGGDLAAVTVYRRLAIQPEAGRRTVLTVGGQPLLVVGGHGQGTVAVLAAGPQAEWSSLGSFRRANECVVLLESLLGYVAGQSGRQGRYDIGRELTFAFPRAMGGMDCVLTGPGLEGAVTRRIAEQTATAVLPPLEQPGNYQLRVDLPTGPRRLGLSLNVDPQESVLRVRPTAEVEKIFAPGLVHVTQSVEGLRHAETLVRQGRERTGQLIPILMAVMVLELLVANRFHRDAVSGQSGPKAVF